MPKRLCVIGLSSLLVAACSSSGTTNPPLPPCTASSGGHLTLAVAAYTAVDPTQTMGCAVFPSNAAGPTVEYLVVPQSGSTTPNDSEPFKLGGTLLAETDTLAFGHESDIDQNGQVIVLMTGKVNSLVTASDCVNKGYIAGYFFGADLITSGQFSTGNNGEIFYSIVPDVVGTLSCAHSVSEVKQVVPSTFVHEFQHMISFNQHSLLRPGFPEDLWLNEALSHYAEENAARRFLRTAPPDSATFCNYVYGDLHNAGD